MLSDTAEEMLVLQAQRWGREFSSLDLTPLYHACDAAGAFILGVCWWVPDGRATLEEIALGLCVSPDHLAKLPRLQQAWAPLRTGPWSGGLLRFICEAFTLDRAVLRIESCDPRARGTAARLVLVPAGDRWRVDAASCD